MRNPLITIFLCFLSTNVCATGQIPELILIGNDTLLMLSTPLARLDSVRYENLETRVRASNKGGECTALWRGYRGVWRLQDDTLRLLKVFNNTLSDGIKDDTISMEGILPLSGYADWFSGDIHVAWGQCIYFDPFSFQCRFEHEAAYTLHSGVVVSREELDNRIVGDRRSFEVALRKIVQNPPIVQAADTNEYQRIEASFNATPDDDGHIRQFNFASLHFQDLEGRMSYIEEDYDHPYLLELLRRVRELEPYIVWVEGEKMPVIDRITLYQAKSANK